MLKGWSRLFDEVSEVLAIFVVLGVVGDFQQLLLVDIIFAIGNFLDAAHFKALAVLNGLDEVAGFQ